MVRGQGQLGALDAVDPVGLRHNVRVHVRARVLRGVARVDLLLRRDHEGADAADGKRRGQAGGKGTKAGGVASALRRLQRVQEGEPD